MSENDRQGTVELLHDIAVRLDWPGHLAKLHRPEGLPEVRLEREPYGFALIIVEGTGVLGRIHVKDGETIFDPPIGQSGTILGRAAPSALETWAQAAFDRWRRAQKAQTITRTS